MSGPPSPERQLFRLALVLGAGVLLFGLVAAGIYLGPILREVAKEPPPVEVASDDALWTEYADNVVAADQKYTGRVVEFRVFGPVEQDSGGNYYIAGNTIHGRVFSVSRVPCYVAPGSVARLANAPPGPQHFRVRGRCQGRRLDARAHGGFIVIVTDCEIR